MYNLPNELLALILSYNRLVPLLYRSNVLFFRLRKIVKSQIITSVDIIPYYLTKITACTSPVIPNGVIYLKFNSNFNELINNLPSSLKIIIFSKSFNHPVTHWPTNLTHIKFGDDFNQPLNGLHRLTHLYFGHDFNQSIQNLPWTIIYLVFGKNFNQPLNSETLPNLSYVKFGASFDDSYIFVTAKQIVFDNNEMYLSHATHIKTPHKFSNLPNTVTHLICSKFSTRSVRKIHEFPSSLLRLTLGDEFNDHIYFPNTLTHLKFGHRFNKPFDNLPLSLSHLTFGYLFNQPIDNLLPPRLKSVVFGSRFNQPIENWPNDVEVILFGYDFNQNVNKLPSNLRRLMLSYEFRKPLNHLPQFIKTIHFDIHGQVHKLSDLPKSIESITFTGTFNSVVDNLPSSLLIIKFGNVFDQSVDNLPQTLKVIVFGTQFDQSVDNLPKSLEKITFGKNFSHPIDKLPNVLYLKFLSRFGNFDQLPRSLVVLIYNGYCTEEDALANKWRPARNFDFPQWIKYIKINQIKC